MSRRRNNDTCRNCGDTSATNPETWEPTGLCVACSATAPRAARKASNAARRSDRDSVVVAPSTGPVNGPYSYVQTYRGEVVVNADGEPV